MPTFVSNDVLLETGLIVLGCVILIALYGMEAISQYFRRRDTNETTPPPESAHRLCADKQSGSGDFGRKRSVVKHQSEDNNCRFRGYSSPGAAISEPDDWPLQFQAAAGLRQSPINICYSKVTLMPAIMQNPLTFNKQYFSPPHRMTILNDGYSILLGTCFLDDFPTLSGGPLRSRYRFNLAQFRWGPTNDEGSEHTIDSKRYAMEMQLMHIRGERVYENLEEAAKQKALVFLSFVFEVTNHDNPYLAPLVNNICKIMAPNTPHDLEPFPLCWLFQPFKARYFYYNGSITCPPCTEGADWIIQQEPLAISNYQLNMFRSVMGVSGRIISNSRPVQELNSRKIEFYI